MTPDHVTVARRGTFSHLWAVKVCGVFVRDFAFEETAEACAAVADDHDESATFPTAGVDTGRIWRSASARRIAEQIRQRAASRAQPAPNAPKETP